MQQFIACHHCGFVSKRVPLAAKTVATCPRCHMYLYGEGGETLGRGLAYYTVALVAWILSITLPVLTFKLNGQEIVSTVTTGVIALHERGFWELALAVLLCAVIMPGVKIIGSMVVLIAGLLERSDPSIRWLAKMVKLVTPFAMVEVFLLGIIVAYVKMVDYGDIIVGIGTFGAVASILAIAAADSEIDHEELWSAIGKKAAPTTHPERQQPIVCHDCGWLGGPELDHKACPRCGAAMHRRKPGSLQRTWALALTATVLYIPANVYPVMVITNFGNDLPATIISGVVDMVHHGMYPIAALVFIASIAVPIAKLIGIYWLLITVQRGRTERLPERTKIFAVIEGIGRWSMVDVFMIAILAGMIQLGGLFTIQAGVGAIAFCGVVLITMLASMSFDPRLMWDQLGKPNG